MEATAATADELRTTWGRRLRALRRRNDESQVDIAGKSGLDQSAVSRAERGRADLDTYVRLAAANGTTLEEITNSQLATELDEEAAEADE